MIPNSIIMVRNQTFKKVLIGLIFAIFAKLNPREMCSKLQFAKINPREIMFFLKTKTSL